MAKIGRNDPCSCGSGKKYKKCCFGRERVTTIDVNSVAIGQSVVVADTDYIKSVFERVSHAEGRIEQTDPSSGKVVLKASVNMFTGTQQPTWFDWDFWTVQLNGKPVTRSLGQTLGDVRWSPQQRTIDITTKKTNDRKRRR